MDADIRNQSFVLTPPGAGAIAVLRVVGPHAASIVNRLFRSRRGRPLPAQRDAKLRLGYVVDGAERIELESGKFFSNTVRIAIQQSSGTTNYYWFSAGTGLIRYSLQTTDANYPDGRVVGEIDNWYHSR